MGSQDLDRFLEVARRELPGCDVQLLEDHPDPETPAEVLLSPLPDGRCLVVEPGEGCPQRGELERRVLMLIKCFAETLGGPTRERPTPAETLYLELKTLTDQISARDAIVIDVDSPVVWGASSLGALAEEALLAQGEGQSAALTEQSQQVITALRARPDLDTRRRGGRSRFILREASFSALARGFADIYLLVLVFDGSFDELRTERAALATFSRIEELVLALPPVDPDPSGGGGKVVALASRR